MAGMSDEQLERSLFPDGCQPGRCVTIGGDAPNTALEDLMAALDALDDGAAPPPIVETPPAQIEPEAPSALLFASKAAANAAMLRAAREARHRRNLERERLEEDARLAAKAERKRKLACERQRRKRDKDRAPIFENEDDLLASLDSGGAPIPYEPTGYVREFDKRLAALLAATVNHAGDPFLKQLQNRAHEYAVAWVTRELVRKRCAGKVSARNVARHHPDKSMTKRRAERLLEVVAKLEMPGRPWRLA
ncbi:hypothetical protein XH83_15355 [Bradyrhizobium sp. CCBAU 53351]|uniref:hypothetical protein n=1 Tax=Bradyrhizobium sp. CCBAU 53351 TaxID=1325114 RepID=UPI001886BFAE|nr:hypothetical protein [Bradyrhizobium sp. CCBAU 53351]QOZ76708.1 hypothetical protein XH83_15355 [Bradyrhizobium sp. CCBAU 53351]